LLQSEIVTLHLSTATLFLATVLIMTLKTRRPENVGKIYSSQLGLWGIITLFALFMQIVLGGMVSSHFAGLACPDFPTCLGQWWPGFQGIAGIHFTHRLGALLVSVIILSFAVKVLRTKELPASLRRNAIFIIILLVAQVSLGISNVVFHLPVVVSVSHLAVAEGLFALILMNTYEIRHIKLRQSH
jgi:heme a synthase